MRFDMRAPSFSTASTRDLYAAALEMASWGDANGCTMLTICEHHGSPDGYLPSPLVLASAMAGRTSTVPIQIAAILVPLYDPLRLAEDMAVLDIVSAGRVSYVVGVGSRTVEYELLGRPVEGRGRTLEQAVGVMQRAWTGEPFEHEGRTAHVTPKPMTDGGPMLLMGGNTPAAVRRAARLGLGMLAQGGDPSLESLYAEECEKAGKTPGMMLSPPPGTVTSAFVSEDPDRTWSEIGRYLLHDAQMYDSWWSEANKKSASGSSATSVEELRAQGAPYTVFTPEEAVAYVKSFGILLTQPLSGGLPPELAWPSLELIANRVLPALP